MRRPSMRRAAKVVRCVIQSVVHFLSSIASSVVRQPSMRRAAKVMELETHHTLRGPTANQQEMLEGAFPVRREVALSLEIIRSATEHPPKAFGLAHILHDAAFRRRPVTARQRPPPAAPCPPRLFLPHDAKSPTPMRAVQEINLYIGYIYIYQMRAV